MVYFKWAEFWHRTGWSVNEATVPVVSKNTNELKIGAPERFGL